MRNVVDDGGRPIARERNEQRESRLDDVVQSLCSEMLVVAGIETDRAKAREKSDDAVTSGRAAEIFGRMVKAMGGPADFVDNCGKHLAWAPIVRPIHASGFLAAADTRAIGNAIIELGGGRHTVGESLNHAVGFSNVASIGTQLDDLTPLAVVHAASEEEAAKAAQDFLAACELSESPPEGRPVIYEILTD